MGGICLMSFLHNFTKFCSVGPTMYVYLMVIIAALCKLKFSVWLNAIFFKAIIVLILNEICELAAYLLMQSSVFRKIYWNRSKIYWKPIDFQVNFHKILVSGCCCSVFNSNHASLNEKVGNLDWWNWSRLLSELYRFWNVLLS